LQRQEAAGAPGAWAKQPHGSSHDAGITSSEPNARDDRGGSGHISRRRDRSRPREPRQANDVSHATEPRSHLTDVGTAVGSVCSALAYSPNHHQRPESTKPRQFMVLRCECNNCVPEFDVEGMGCAPSDRCELASSFQDMDTDSLERPVCPSDNCSFSCSEDSAELLIVERGSPTLRDLD
jgi:hypothetical protein